MEKMVTRGVWMLLQPLMVEPEGFAEFVVFGRPVSATEEGERLAVGIS